MNKNVAKSSLLTILLSMLLVGCGNSNPTPNLPIDNTSSISSLVKESKVNRNDLEYYYANYLEDYYDSEKCGISFIRETPKKDIYYTVWKENLTFDFPLLAFLQIKLKDNKYHYYDFYTIDKPLTFNDFSFIEVGKTTFEDIEKIENCWIYYHSGYSTHHMIDGSIVKVNYDIDNVVTSIEYHPEEKFVSDNDAKELAALLP